MSEGFFSKKLFNEFCLPCLRLVGVQLTINLPFLISLFYIGRLNSAVSIGAFGLTVTFFSMFFTSILLGAQEHIGIKGAQYFTSGQEYKLIKIFWKSIYFTLLIWFIYFVLSLFSFRILIFFNIEEVVARATSNLLICTNPYLFFHGINQIIQNYLSAQKITKPFTKMNIMAAIIILIFSKIFILDLDYREIGFAIAAGIQEVCNFLYFVYYLIRNVKNFSFVPQFFNNSKKLAYICHCFFTSFSFYGAFIAYESNTYFAALLHDNDDLASWIASSYPISIFYFINIGISFNIRNLIGHKIGEKDFKGARSNTKIYFIYIFIFSLLINILQVVFRSEIASIFTNNEKIHALVSYNTILMTIHIYPTLMMYSLNSILRLLDYNKFQFYTNIVVYPIMVITLSYIMCFTMKLGVIGIIVGFGIAKYLFTIIMLIKIFFIVDWEKSVLDKVYSTRGSEDVVDYDIMSEEAQLFLVD